jgi:membrane fusion protein, heavy metal efflux system
MAASSLAAFGPRARTTTVLLLTALQWGVFAWSSLNAYGAPNERDRVAVTADQLHQLTVAKVELYPFRAQKLAVGQIGYNEDTSTAVLAPFPGRVTRLIAKVGDRVERGQPLFEIDSPEVVQPQNDFVAAAAALNKARSQLDLARIVEKRFKDLYEGKAAPLKEWQQAQAQLVAAENDIRSAEIALEAAHVRLRIVGFTDEEVAALRAKGVVRRSTPIAAPIEGTVIARKVGPGQHVRNDSGEALYTIADLSTMWVKAQVPENDIPFVQLGQEVEVKVSALPGRVFRARVTAIGAATDLSTRRIIVRSEVPNTDSALKSEMFASFKILTGLEESSPAVPVEAVIREGELAVVWMEEEPMRFRRCKVTLGIEQEGRVQIREGLQAGDRILVRGAIFVHNEAQQ